MEELLKNTFCKKCKLHTTALNPCIRGRGNISSNLLLLGECPGANEDREGQVFIGTSGKLLQYYIDNLGLDCYISNAVLCRSIDKDGKNKTPTPKIVDCCKPFTIDLILEMKPKVIVTLGKVALTQLMKVNTNMEVIRGKVLYHPELDLYIIPTYHPAYLMYQSRENGEKRYYIDFKEDLELARNLCNAPKRRRIESVPITLTDTIDINKYLSELKDAPAVAIDIETTGLNPKVDRITDISFCSEVGKGVHIRWDYISDDTEKIKLVQDVLTSQGEKIFHNAMFDIEFLRSVGFEVTGPVFDTMLGYHTITMSYEGGRATSLYRLKTMAWFLTQEGGYDDILDKYGGIVGVQKMEEDKKEDDDKKKKSKKTPKKKSIPADIDIKIETRFVDTYNYIDTKKEERINSLKLTPKEFYSAMDADVTYRIYKYLKLKIDKDYSFVFYNIIMPTCLVLLRLHENGVKIDIDYINSLVEENNKRAEKVRLKFLNTVGDKMGEDFNINSSTQLGKYMYEVLKLPKNKKFVTAKLQKPSTDEAAITFYSKKQPNLKHILDYRGIMKETSTYLVGYTSLADEFHRVYPEYKQIGTATGRCSCNNPNLQNVPRDNRIRNMVIPEKDHKIILADLSQVELRVLAMISEDPAMIRAFVSGHDFHSYTACIMFNISIDEFDKNNKKHNELRSVAKTINFGMVYQRGAKALADQVGISISEAENFMRKFFRSYPKVEAWIKYIKSFAYHHGYVENIYERRRYLPDIKSTNNGFRSGAERKAVNTPIQGSASDIFLFGLIRFQEWIDDNNMKSKIIGTVHDSILSEVPLDEVDIVSEHLPRLMTENIPRVTIELAADLDVLDKWVK